jgi:thiol-disulfide isomerase/thioredoxin
MNLYTLPRRVSWRAALVLLQFFMLIGPAAAYEIGESPRDRIGTASTGEEILLSQGHGRIQIVTFWATWCAPCRKELPVLASFLRQAGEHQLRVLAVNLEEDRRVYREAVKIMSDFGLTFVHDKRGAIASNFDVKSIPHMLILDADGVVVGKHVGYSEKKVHDIVAELNDLLRENRAPDTSDE